MAIELLKLRSDLVVRSDTDGGTTVYTIKDPVTRRYFQLRAPEYYLLSRADGKTTPADAARLTAERFGINILPEAAEAFYRRMQRLLFFEGPAFERYSAATPNLRRRSLGMIPLKAFDPDRALTRWIERLRFLFRPAAVVLAFVAMIVAVAVAASQHSLWSGGILGAWRLTSIPLLLAAIFALAWVHETGHALTLKHFGGSVHEMGFLLLYFQPCFYCNISDTYLLPGRQARLYVGLAGLFFQGLVTALAILVWRMIEPGNLIADFLWVFTVVSLALFLFNFNPLIKLDGYYILVELLRIPNLRAKAFRYWRGVAGRWLRGTDAVGTERDTRLRRIYRWYGLAASVYTGTLIGWVLYHVTRFLHGQWGAAGVILLYGFLAALTVSMRKRSRTVADTQDTNARESNDIATPTQPRWMKPLIFWGGVAVLIILAAVIRLERRVGSACEVKAGSRFTVTTPSGGTLETELVVGGRAERRERSLVQATAADFSVVAYGLNVQEGDSVRAGDTLVVLSSNRYEAELLSRTAERDEIVAERNLLLSGPKKDAIVGLRSEIAEMVALVENKRLELERGRLSRDRQLISQEEFEAKQAEYEMAQAREETKRSELALLISEPKAEELAVKDAQIAGFDAEIEFLTTQIAASTVLAPIDGVVTRVERGGVLAEIADCDPVRLFLSVDQDDIADVAVGDAVTLKVRSYPYRTFYGRVARIAGDADSTGGRQRFIVSTDVENPDGLLRPGMTGQAKIACGKRPILALAARRLIQFVRIEFWSWW
ncbi:MAG TPA: efflux RND transporter periplasmic adaptor subunit [Acidobacteriota bacterium]|nr:efflux RND transporter periplasmic adaptor subunit [Acidobacteriota bacterium]